LNIRKPLSKDQRPVASILWGNIFGYLKQIAALRGFKKTRKFIIIYKYPKREGGTRNENSDDT
jgi:hypothetical protein